jgi:hypothetical protein
VKKTIKRLQLTKDNVRTLSSPDLIRAAGGEVNPNYSNPFGSYCDSCTTPACCPKPP